jgi:hypothetical protein
VEWTDSLRAVGPRETPKGSIGPRRVRDVPPRQGGRPRKAIEALPDSVDPPRSADDSAGPNDRAKDGSNGTEEFRRRLSELQAELRRRAAARVSSVDNATAGTPPSPEVAGLDDQQLSSAIDFIRTFLDSASSLLGPIARLAESMASSQPAPPVGKVGEVETESGNGAPLSGREPRPPAKDDEASLEEDAAGPPRTDENRSRKRRRRTT